MKYSMIMPLTALIIAAVILLPETGYCVDRTLSQDVDLVNDSIHTTITMHGQLLVGGMPKEGVKIGILVDEMSTGNHIFADEVTTNSSGHYISFFKLENTRTGTYQAFASASGTQGGDATANAYFSIGECTENWTYTEWSTCGSDYRQTRTCTDNNHCGTENDKSSSSRECTPTCAEVGGHICTTSQTCDGSFVDVSDTDKCCKGTCRTPSPNTGTGTTHDNDNNVNDTANETVYEVVDNEPVVAVNNTVIEDTNESANDTVADDIGINESIDVSDEVHDETPTGGLISLISGSRWLIADAVLIILIVILGGKIVSARAKKDNDDDAPKKYSFRPKSGKPGIMKYFSNIGGIISFSGHDFAHDEKRTRGPGITKLKVVVPDDD
ncbi:MAG: hypothetical protein DRN71_03400 [Candidatus Nanohalarchaeota archaeon]|nr:MAG: hypothetical protein DRN71_03400 [Candidatus Nanohaloarchaeota archaeon]